MNQYMYAYHVCETKRRREDDIIKARRQTEHNIFEAMRQGEEDAVSKDVKKKCPSAFSFDGLHIMQLHFAQCIVIYSVYILEA